MSCNELQAACIKPLSAIPFTSAANTLAQVVGKGVGGEVKDFEPAAIVPHGGGYAFYRGKFCIQL